MIIFRTLLSSSKQRIFNPVFTNAYRSLICRPANYFFWNKDSDKPKETDAMKKFKELNKEFKASKEFKKFNINKEAAKSFLSEAERQKQEKAVKKAVDEYLDTYKFDPSFNEFKFINIISQVSYLYDNSAVINDSRFADTIEEMAQKLRDFKEYRNISLFISFCSFYDLKRPLIWEYFNGIIHNIYQKLSFEDKAMILSCFNKQNEAEFEEFFELFENEFIKQFRDEKGKIDYTRVYRALTLYRTLEKGTENFFYTIEDIIKANIDDMDMENLVLFLLHYVNCANENLVTKSEIISRIEKRLSQSHIFLNNAQIIGVLFAFIKYGKGSDIFYELMERRTLTLLDNFSLDQLKKLIILYANLPKHATSVFKGIEKHVSENFKKIPRPFLSTLIQTLTECGYYSESLFKNIENYLVKNVFNMENEEFSKNLWAFSQRVEPDSLYFKKAAECAKGKLDQYNAKEVATLVWSFSNIEYNDNELYDSIEEQVYDKLQKKAYSLRDISLLLWSYIQKVPIRPPTVDLMKEEILRQKQDAEAWDIAIILWGYSKFEGYPIKEFFKELQDVTTPLVSEMTNYELSISLRAYAETDVGNEALYQAYVEKTLEVINGLNYSEVISCVYSFSLVTCVNQEIFKEVIEKLKERAIYLQSQIQVAPEKKVKSFEEEIESAEEYLKNEAIEKLRNPK